MFFIMCVLSKIATELEKTRLENREIINVINKALKNKQSAFVMHYFIGSVLIIVGRQKESSQIL